MLVDIANQQALSEDVRLFIVNDDFDVDVLKGLNYRIKVAHIGRPPGSRNPWYLLKTLLTLTSFRPDVIHAHQFSLIRFLRWLKIPKLLTAHAMNIPVDASLKLFDVVACISKAVNQDLATRVPGCNYKTVYNGICFENSVAKHNFGQQRFGNSPFRIIQIGRLVHEMKGQDVLIKALSIILKRDQKPIEVDFVGSGPSLEYLRKLAADESVDDQCRFLGNVDRKELYATLETYDLLVQPSRDEGFGLTVVEGMASAVPVLVSDIEGPMEIIKNGEFGSYFKSEDPDSCADAILEIIKLSSDPDFPKKQQKALDYAKSQFDICSTAANYVEIYKRISS